MSTTEKKEKIEKKENSEEKMRSLAMELRTLESYASDIQSRLGLVDSVLNDLSLSGATIQGLEKVDANDEVLMSLGGSSHLKVKIIDKEKVLVRLGAGVSIEKPVKDASVHIENEVNNLFNTRQTFQKQFNQILERMTAVRKELEQMSRAPA